jgi:hypothetical protein
MYDPDRNRVAKFCDFRLMITPSIIRWLFGIGLLIIPVIMGCMSVEGSQSSEAPGRFIAGAFLSLFLLPLWRVACELAIVAFSINDRLGEIAAELKNQGRGEGYVTHDTCGSTPVLAEVVSPENDS